MTRDVKTEFRLDRSSGTVHAVTIVNGQAQSFEADNLDTSGEFRTIETIDGIDPKHLCRRCFPLIDEDPS